MSLPGTRKCLSEKTASVSGCSENSSRIDVGCKKNTAESTAVRTPTSEPNVPGALGKYPTPSAVATAIASRGFFCGGVPPPGISVDGVICLAETFKILVFVFCPSLARRFTRCELAHIKHRFGHDILLAGPVAEVALAAALAAKGKIRVTL